MFFVIFGLISVVTADVRVINGTNASITDYPFMANVGFYCGGSILSDFWVLTAAHCTGNSVRLGTDNSTANPGQTHDIILWIRHEKYNSWTLENDIAVVRLVEPILFDNNTKPVKLPEKMYEVPGNWETKANLTGFTLHGSLTHILKETEVLVLSNEECEKRHENGMIFASMLCAGNPEGGTGQCKEDHGGPLTINGTQIGIASWSIMPCASPEYPGVYTKVSHYIDWIKDKTGLTIEI